MPARVAGLLAPLVPRGSSLLVGLSGGADSVALLHILAGLAPGHGWQLSAMHVHHGISPNADAWASFCTRLCASLQLPLHIEHVDITPLRDKGVEAAARELRHQALAAQPVDFVALAHHLDDQAETLLLQLLRGAGVKGAAAMPLVRQAAPATPVLLRPLLDSSRSEIVAYLAENKHEWVEDESNADESYPRNFLRRSVLPMLESRFPASRAMLARSARHFAEADALLDALAELDGQGAFDGESLAVPSLAGLDDARARNLLRWFLQQRGVLMPDSRRLDEMLRQLLEAHTGAQVCIGWGGWELRRYRGRAYVRIASIEPSKDLQVTWRGEQSVALPGGVLRFESGGSIGLSAAKLAAGEVTIRLRRQNDRLRPDASRPPRALRYLFQEAGIPPWQRVEWPLLYCGEQLVAVPELALDAAWRAVEGEPAVSLRWSRNN